MKRIDIISSKWKGLRPNQTSCLTSPFDIMMVPFIDKGYTSNFFIFPGVSLTGSIFWFPIFWKCNVSTNVREMTK